jgi:hypothetical protein
VGGLIAIGLSPWQVLAIIVTASLILFAALALNGHAGTKYGLPFPVIIRASYGIYWPFKAKAANKMSDAVTIMASTCHGERPIAMSPPFLRNIRR